MHYLLLWSGDVRGMRKAHIPAVEAPGMTGHLGPHSLVVPDRAAIAAALPYRFRKAFDRAGGFWFDKNRETSPAHVTLRDRRGKYLTTLYLQPIREESN